MNNLNGSKGKSRNLIIRALGLGRPARESADSHVMTSDGAASVDLKKLFSSNGYKASSAQLKRYGMKSETGEMTDKK